MTKSEMLSAVNFESFGCKFFEGENDDIETVKIAFNMRVELPFFFKINCTLEIECTIDELENFTRHYYLSTLGHHQGYDESPIQYPLVQIDGFHRQVYSVDEWFSFCEKHEKLSCLDAFLTFHKPKIFNIVKNDFIQSCGKPTLVESKKRLAA